MKPLLIALVIVVGLPIVSYCGLIELKCTGDDYYYTTSSELPLGGSIYKGEVTLLINKDTNSLTKVTSQKQNYNDVDYETTETHYNWSVDYAKRYMVKNGENIGEAGSLNRYTGEIKIYYISRLKTKKGIVETKSSSFEGVCEQTTKKF